MENKTNVKESFKARFAALRAESGLSQSKLGKVLSLSPATIGYYENGDRLPDIDTAARIANYFGVSADYLLGLSDVKSTEQDMKMVCNVTGLNENAVKTLMYMNQIKNGETLTRSTESEVSRLKDNIKTYTEKLETLYLENNGLQERLQAYVETRPHTTAHHKDMCKDKAFDDAFLLHASRFYDEESLSSIIDDEKISGQKYNETLNIFIESEGFFDFIKNLTIYSITDFQKKSKRIFSVSTDESFNESYSFVFNSSLIEQGLIAKLQQFIISQKRSDAYFHLTDIESRGE